jgi:hypothetical protein
MNVLLHAQPNKKPEQGDQIERIFAQWATVCFGQFFRKLQN